MSKIRLTMHINSLLSLAANRHIYFKYPDLQADIEICLGDDIAQLELYMINDNMLGNIPGMKKEDIN